MKSYCLATVAVALIAQASVALAQMPYLAVKPVGPKTQLKVNDGNPKAQPETPDDKFDAYAGKHKVMRPNRKNIELWDAQRNIDTTNPYGRIAADCMNQQDNLDPSGVKRANRCIETRTKAYDASVKKKSGQGTVVKNPSAAVGNPSGAGIP